MTNRDSMVFAFGPNGRYFFRAPSQWSYYNLPHAIDQVIASREIADVLCVAFGPDPSTYIVWSKNTSGVSNLRWACVPPKLQVWLQGGNHSSVHVALGPDQSFFAWDDNSFRWSGIPDSMEEAIQGWMTPTGWGSGSPRSVSLGMEGSYFAITNAGAACWDIDKSYPSLANLISGWRSRPGLNIWPSIKGVYLNPFVHDSYVVVDYSGAAWYAAPGLVLGAIKVVVTSLTDPTLAKTLVMDLNAARLSEQLKKAQAAAEELAREERERKAKPEEERQKRRKQEGEQRKQEEERRKQEEQRRKAEEEQRQQEEKRRKQEQAAAAAAAEERAHQEKEEQRSEQIRISYKIWVATCEHSIKNMAKLFVFPHPPVAHCACQDISCAFQKLGDHGIKICVHDLEVLLRVDTAYSAVWLEKMRRQQWHSDKWSKAPIDVRRDLKAKADEMFKMYGQLIEKK